MIFSPISGQGASILARLVVILVLAIAAADYLNREAYSDAIGKTLIKLHAERRAGPDTGELTGLLLRRDFPRLQELLDRNASIYALVITDCATEARTCDNQRIVLATSPQAIGGRRFTAAELARYPYVILRHPPASVMDLLGRQPRSGTVPSTIIGRVYSVSTIPTFAEDYRSWLRDPFSANPVWRQYLANTVSCLLAGILTLLVLELFLKIRRMERRDARLREGELVNETARYLRQLEDTERQLREQEERSRIQYEGQIGRIRELERKLQHIEEYRKTAETIIADLEEEKARQAVSFREELERTNVQRLSLQAEFDRYRKASPREKSQASTALEQALNPAATPFERKVVNTLLASPKAREGAWLTLAGFDVAVGKGGSQFVDGLVLSKDFVVVVEAKNYSGAILAEGDPENSVWTAAGPEMKPAPIKVVWGLNPYHQIREYTMSLLNLVKRGRWKVPVFGVIVFPDNADLGGLTERIGRYYRVTRRDRLVPVLERLEAEARRENAFTRRPTPEQLEAVLRGTGFQ